MEMKWLPAWFFIVVLLAGCTSTRESIREWTIDSTKHINDIYRQTADRPSRVELTDGSIFRARAIRIDPVSSFGIVGGDTLKRWPTASTRSIVVRLSSRGSEYALAGIAVGAVVGVVIGYLDGDDPCQHKLDNSVFNCQGRVTKESKALRYGLIGGGLVGGLGVVSAKGPV